MAENLREASGYMSRHDVSCMRERILAQSFRLHRATMYLACAKGSLRKASDGGTLRKASRRMTSRPLSRIDWLYLGPIYLACAKDCRALREALTSRPPCSASFMSRARCIWHGEGGGTLREASGRINFAAPGQDAIASSRSPLQFADSRKQRIEEQRGKKRRCVVVSCRPRRCHLQFADSRKQWIEEQRGNKRRCVVASGRPCCGDDGIAASVVASDRCTTARVRDLPIVEAAGELVLPRLPVVCPKCAEDVLFLRAITRARPRRSASVPARQEGGGSFTWISIEEYHSASATMSSSVRVFAIRLITSCLRLPSRKALSWATR
jgi:hypothetical protein